MNNEPIKTKPIKPNLARQSVWRVYPPPAVSKGTLARTGRTGGEISEHQNIEVSGRRISGKQGIGMTEGGKIRKTPMVF